MPEAWLECVVCRAQLETGPYFEGCPNCARQNRKAPLVVKYRFGSGLAGKDRKPGLWRWSNALPPVAEGNIVSLHEGNTPLIELKSAPILLKNETINPTWSYKDRANTVSISMARQLGFANVATISTGNHGVATAAYSASAGLRSVVFCHEDAPDLQLTLMRHYGASVFRGGRQNELLQGLVKQGGWFPASVVCPRGGVANPFGIEGFKTIAFELFEQLEQRVPDRVFVPVGSGDGIYGIWKGFCELRQARLVDQLPQMYACQAAGADPYVRAFEARAERLTEVESAQTIALSIAEKIGGEQALRAVYDSGGAALRVGDDDILKAARCLASEGFALEPASAAALACAQTLLPERGLSEVWVVVGTGAAVKWPDSLGIGFTRPDKLSANVASIEELSL